MKKHFNRNLITAEEEEEEQFQSSHTCYICQKLINDDDEKVRDHCHISRKFRGATHWSCNINLHLTKSVPVTFHNLRGYDSRLIFCELWIRKIHAIFFKQKLSLYWQYVFYEF